MTSLEVRPAIDSDLAAVTDLYNRFVVDTHVTFDIDPVPVNDRRSWYAQFAMDGPHRLFVATEDGSIVGWAASTPFRPKAAYQRSVETTVYVDPDAAGRGIGTRLYRALLDALASSDVHRCLAAVAVPNPASVALHERFGFREVGRFSEVGFKLGRYWDVIWFERKI